MDTENLTKRISKLSLDNLQSEIPLLNKKSEGFFLRSKVMIIMKGLPGSGKSTITKAFVKKYENSVVCSADKYFETQKKYKYDMALLPQAHTYCKHRALSSAENQIPLIIIDNSNIQYWEMKFYLKVAKAFNYIIFVIEPNTPWSKDPKILEAKNTHGVNISVLKKKLKSYETISPVFFGWFLNDADSHFVLEKARDWLKRAMQVKEFKQDYRKRKDIISGHGKV